tara:strand:+ start:353 stop:655 length:303 start_codon:yes stop_codon:yes gene_type:complete
MDIIVENKNIKNAGRKKGSGNCSYYNWNVVMFDKETNTFKEGRFCSIRELNEEWKLALNSDYVKRIMYRYRADMTQRNKENSFLQRWGHIKIDKIHELKV